MDLPYAGSHLCRNHFRIFVEKRVRRELHRQAPGLNGGTLAVALSGGKDSSVMLSLLVKFLGMRRNVKIVAITVDEGIEGYRSKTIAQATKLTESLGVEHMIRTFKDELGTSTDIAAKTITDLAPCSSCGVWRRTVLNKAAREIGAVRLAVGFNLDDLAQTVLMNLLRGEPHRLTQMAPHVRKEADFVPRIAPLAAIPEREVYLYATLLDIPFDHAECPYAPLAGRNIFRETLWRLEDSLPGTRHSIMRTREKLLEVLADALPPTQIGRCSLCGEPAAGALCRSCAFVKSALGASVPDRSQ
jgi:uncharacterized protein (TIGR00269 family)